MAFAKPEDRGLALGAWGAAQSTAAGLAIAFSGVVNDLGSSLAVARRLRRGARQSGDRLHARLLRRIILLFATLVVIGPLVRSAWITRCQRGRASLRHAVRRASGLEDYDQ